MNEADKEEALRQYIAEGKQQVIPYQGKPEYVERWERKKAMRRSTNSTSSKAKNGRAASGRFFKRGAGSV